jgi:hypothetical protein
VIEIQGYTSSGRGDSTLTIESILHSCEPSCRTVFDPTVKLGLINTIDAELQITPLSPSTPGAPGIPRASPE